ncbi:MAG: YcjF family protein [Chthoniobacterales bacterium]
MDQPVLLNVVAKLEALLGKLPDRIRTPVLRELTPLKQLFLQKRPPRFLLLGSIDKPAPELVNVLFGLASEPERAPAPLSIFRWQEMNAGARGAVSILDARGALDSARLQIEEELKRQPADVILFLDDAIRKRRGRKAELENLISCLKWSEAGNGKPVVAGVSFSSATGKERGKQDDGLAAQLARALPEKERLLEVIALNTAEDSLRARQKLMSILGRAVPNEARLELIRISRDRQQQRDVAQSLVKSTSAICAAIGAQPIPLADLPILTTLQLGMVSAIMYVSGRERSVRAATEFVGALGANVGAAMLLREGVRAMLKFFPGWGNVVCGMVAGAGTYGIGRAAIAFFVEGVSLKEARRTYRASGKRPMRETLPLPNGANAVDKLGG